MAALRMTSQIRLFRFIGHRSRWFKFDQSSSSRTFNNSIVYLHMTRWYVQAACFESKKLTLRELSDIWFQDAGILHGFFLISWRQKHSLTWTLFRPHTSKRHFRVTIILTLPPVCPLSDPKRGLLLFKHASSLPSVYTILIRIKN